MKKNLLVSLALLFIFFVFINANDDGCGESVQSIEEKKVEANQRRLMSQTDIPVLDKSLERINIKKRLELFEDENKVSYIYLISHGKVMAFYPMKGKVTSGSKRLTTNQKSTTYGVMESPSLDGAYGSSDMYVFFWTTDGTYIQWNGQYMLCDKPLKLRTPPEITMEISKKNR